MTLLLRLRKKLSEGIRHRVTLLGAMVLALLLSSGLLAFTTSQNAFFLLFSLLLAAVMVSSFLNRLMLAGLRAELEMPPHPMASEFIPVCLILSNHKSWLASFALEIKTPQGRSLHLPVLPAGARFTGSFHHIWFLRGKPAALEFTLETRFPFGFSIRRTKLRVEVPGVIYPDMREQPGFAEVLEELVRRQTAARFGGNEEFSHLREYVAGDAARQIAWGASARRQVFEAPLVRVNMGEERAGLRIRLDLGTPYLESMVRLAAYLVWELQYKNLEFVFLVGGEEFAVGRAADAYTVLKYLATVMADPKAPIPHEPAVFLLSRRAGWLFSTGANAQRHGFL